MELSNDEHGSVGHDGEFGEAGHESSSSSVEREFDAWTAALELVTVDLNDPSLEQFLAGGIELVDEQGVLIEPAAAPESPQEVAHAANPMIGQLERGERGVRIEMAAHQHDPLAPFPGALELVPTDDPGLREVMPARAAATPTRAANPE